MVAARAGLLDRVSLVGRSANSSGQLLSAYRLDHRHALAIDRANLVDSSMAEDPTAIQFDRIIVASGWQLVLALFVPLILVAWQYRPARSHPLLHGNDSGRTLFAAVLWHPPVSEAVSVIGMTLGRLFLYLVVGFVITRMVSAQREQRQKLSDANARLAPTQLRPSSLPSATNATGWRVNCMTRWPTRSVRCRCSWRPWTRFGSFARAGPRSAGQGAGQRSLRPDRDAPGLASTARLAVGRSRAGAGRA